MCINTYVLMWGVAPSLFSDSALFGNNPPDSARDSTLNSIVVLTLILTLTLTNWILAKIPKTFNLDHTSVKICINMRRFNNK